MREAPAQAPERSTRVGVGADRDSGPPTLLEQYRDRRAGDRREAAVDTDRQGFRRDDRPRAIAERLARWQPTVAAQREADHHRKSSLMGGRDCDLGLDAAVECLRQDQIHSRESQFVGSLSVLGQGLLRIGNQIGSETVLQGGEGAGHEHASLERRRFDRLAGQAHRRTGEPQRASHQTDPLQSTPVGSEGESGDELGAGFHMGAMDLSHDPGSPMNPGGGPEGGTGSDPLLRELGAATAVDQQDSASASPTLEKLMHGIDPRLCKERTDPVPGG